jgi:HAD superfamily hydrolase (TIGR01509 family)
MLGKHNCDIVRDFFGNAGLSAQEIVNHGARKEQLYRDLIQPELAARLVPGVVHFLDRHQNTLLGLATNAEPANVEFVLDSADIRKYFSAVVDGHQVERPKPYPDVYLKAASLLGVAPDRCVVFEDSPFGIQAARAAGMKVVGLTTTCAQLANVDLAVPDFLAPELETWLRSIALVA